MTRKVKKILIIIGVFFIVTLIWMGNMIIKNGYSKYYFEIGERLLIQGQYPQAIAWLEKAFKINPKDSDIEFKLFDAYVGYKQYDKAVSLFEKQMIRYPDKVWNFHRLSRIGQLYVDTKRYDKAIELYERMISRHPTAYGGDMKLSEVYEKIGNIDKAIYHKQRALVILEKYPAYIQMSSLQKRLREELKVLKGKNAAKSQNYKDLGTSQKGTVLIMEESKE